MHIALKMVSFLCFQKLQKELSFTDRGEINGLASVEFKNCNFFIIGVFTSEYFSFKYQNLKIPCIGLKMCFFRDVWGNCFWPLILFLAGGRDEIFWQYCKLPKNMHNLNHLNLQWMGKTLFCILFSDFLDNGKLALLVEISIWITVQFLGKYSSFTKKNHGTLVSCINK